MHSKELHRNFSSISAFDLDHTLFNANSGYLFGRYLCRRKLLPLKALGFIIGCYVSCALGFLSIEALHQKAFKRLFKGRLSSTVKQWTEDFLEENFEKSLYLPAINELKSAQDRGHLTAILSCAPCFLVEPIAKRLNVPIWEGTEYGVDNDHKFSHIASLVLGCDKASILKDIGSQYNISKQKIHAYSDSHHDLPFLYAAGHACGVKPNRKLRAICQKNKWPII